MSPSGIGSASRRSTAAISEIKPGVDGRAIFDGTCEHLRGGRRADAADEAAGRPLADGFFHGLGHGVGLEVHEEPGLGLTSAKNALQVGDVVTVEPGLYRQGYGGVRLEDLVLVTGGRRREPDAVPLRPDALDDVSTQTIDKLFLEERRYPPPAAFAAQANADASIYDEPFEAFWEREGRERVTWFEPFTRYTSGICRTRSGSWAAR